MHKHFCFLLFLLLATCTPQTHAYRRYYCEDKCRRVIRVAKEDCDRTNIIRKRCHIKRCTFPTSRRGWICTAKPLSVKPSGTPSPKPIVIPRGCRARCYRSRLPAFRDCRYNSRPVAGCQISRCPFPPNPKRQGYACLPMSSPPTTNGTAFVSSSNLSPVVACTDDKVLVVRNQSQPIGVGGVIWNYPSGGQALCDDCNFLIRNVAQVSQDVASLNGRSCPTGATCDLLETSFTKAGELFSSALLQQFGLNASMSDIEVEPLFACSSGTSTRVSSSMMSPAVHQVFGVPTSCDTMKNVNSDGRCAYSNCFVGTDGSGDDCFECRANCDNGCGSEDVNVPDSIPLLFDFKEACCTHDHCYSSTFSKEVCDLAFLRDNLKSCGNVNFLLPLPFFGPLSSLRCPNLAMIYYLGVALGGGKAHAEARAKQDGHEESSECAAECPTTQRSGGQGTTTLRIDMLRTKGTFPVSYQMYSIPDELEIMYEGVTIFSTGGLVSGSASIDVSFEGASTIVTARLNAPLSGTAWDIFLGCPKDE